MRRRTLLAAAPLAAALWLAAPAAAQDYRPDRPYDGLFAPPAENGGHHFDLDWAVLTAHDDNLTTEPEFASVPRGGIGGGSGEATARYSYQGHRSRVRATASGRDRYYPGWSNLTGIAWGGEFAASIDVNRSARLSFSQAARFEPFYQLTFVPSGSGSLGAAPPVDPADIEISTPTTPTLDDPLRSARARTSNGGIGYAQKLGPKSTLGVDYSYRLTNLGSGAAPYFSQNVNALINRGLTRYASLRLGYGYGRGRSSGIIDADGRTTPALDPPKSLLTTHNVDVGIGYARPLSRSRRTAFSFTTGSSVISERADSEYRLLLSAALAREVGRTWVATADYRRGVTFIEGFARPAYADTVRLRIGGFVTRHLEIGATTGYAKGYVGLATDSGAYGTYAETADIRVAFNRNLSFVTVYGYSHYDFDPTVDLPFGIGHSMNRHSIRFGISGWLPVVK